LTTENKFNSPDKGMSSVYFLAEWVLKRSNLLSAAIEKKRLKRIYCISAKRKRWSKRWLRKRRNTQKKISKHNSNLLALFPKLKQIMQQTDCPCRGGINRMRLNIA